MSLPPPSEDNSILFSIARHQGIEAGSGPKLIVNCFQPFSELFRRPESFRPPRTARA